jgi:hypothetical protein
MVELAQAYAAPTPVRYVGIDLFEARPASAPGMTLKCAYVQLKGLGVRLHLIPGDPYAALARSANELGKFDMMVVRWDQDPTAVERAWFYFPRLLHAGSRIFLEPSQSSGNAEFSEMHFEEVIRRSADAMRHAARAA